LEARKTDGVIDDKAEHSKLKSKDLKSSWPNSSKQTYSTESWKKSGIEGIWCLET